MPNDPQEPELLHKYMSLNGERLGWACKALITKTLWFSNPTAFNDPFDCAPAVKTSWKRDDILATARRVISRKFKDEPEWKREAELKRFTDVEDFYDLVTEKEAQAHAERFLQGLRAQVGVLSLSADPMNVLMWSHYANNHTGLMMSFSANCRDIIHEAQKVKYVKERPVVDLIGDRTNIMAKMLLNKADFWSYEDEWRSIRVTGEGPYSFNPDALVAITFGQFTTPEQVDAIKQATKEGELDLMYSRAVLNPELYRLEIVDV